MGESIRHEFSDQTELVPLVDFDSDPPSSGWAVRPDGAVFRDGVRIGTWTDWAAGARENFVEFEAQPD